MDYQFGDLEWVPQESPQNQPQIQPTALGQATGQQADMNHDSPPENQLLLSLEKREAGSHFLRLQQLSVPVTTWRHLDAAWFLLF
jgi:hypothetical protein